MTPKKVNHNSKTGKLRDGAQALGPAAKTTYLLDSLASVSQHLAWLPGFLQTDFSDNSTGIRLTIRNNKQMAPCTCEAIRPTKIPQVKESVCQQVHAQFAVV